MSNPPQYAINQRTGRSFPMPPPRLPPITNTFPMTQPVQSQKWTSPSQGQINPQGLLSTRSKPLPQSRSAFVPQTQAAPQGPVVNVPLRQAASPTPPSDTLKDSWANYSAKIQGAISEWKNTVTGTWIRALNCVYEKYRTYPINPAAADKQKQWLNIHVNALKIYKDKVDAFLQVNSPPTQENFTVQNDIGYLMNLTLVLKDGVIQMVYDILNNIKKNNVWIYELDPKIQVPLSNECANESKFEMLYVQKILRAVLHTQVLLKELPAKIIKEMNIEGFYNELQEGAAKMDKFREDWNGHCLEEIKKLIKTSTSLQRAYDNAIAKYFGGGEYILTDTAMGYSPIASLTELPNKVASLTGETNVISPQITQRMQSRSPIKWMKNKLGSPFSNKSTRTGGLFF